MNLIEKVKLLVSRHKFGGSEEQNILKNADLLSFLENNIAHFINNYIHEVGKKEVEDKINRMFERITNEDAKEIARSWYKDAIKRIEKIS